MALYFKSSSMVDIDNVFIRNSIVAKNHLIYLSMSNSFSISKIDIDGL